MVDLKNTVAVIYDRETGEFKGILVDGDKEKQFHHYKCEHKAEEKGVMMNAYEHLDYLSGFDWVQHEHIELYHRANRSVCSVHVRCKIIKIC